MLLLLSKMEKVHGQQEQHSAKLHQKPWLRKPFIQRLPSLFLQPAMVDKVAAQVKTMMDGLLAINQKVNQVIDLLEAHEFYRTVALRPFHSHRVSKDEAKRKVQVSKNEQTRCSSATMARMRHKATMTWCTSATMAKPQQKV